MALLIGNKILLVVCKQWECVTGRCLLRMIQRWHTADDWFRWKIPQNWYRRLPRDVCTARRGITKTSCCDLAGIWFTTRLWSVSTCVKTPCKTTGQFSLYLLLLHGCIPASSVGTEWFLFNWIFFFFRKLYETNKLVRAESCSICAVDQKWWFECDNKYKSCLSVSIVLAFWSSFIVLNFFIYFF